MSDDTDKILNSKLFNQLNDSLYSLVNNQNYIPVDPEDITDPDILKYINNYNKLVLDFKELNFFVEELTRGNYTEIVPPKMDNHIAFRLKELHSMLSYTLWQVSLIADGNYQGQVYFEGDVAVMFNRMIKNLEKRERMLKNEIEQRQSAERISFDKHNLLLSTLEALNTIVVVIDCEKQEILYSNKMAREQFLIYGEYVCFDICGVQLMTHGIREQTFIKQHHENWYSVKTNELPWDKTQKAVIFLVEDITKVKMEQEELVVKASFDLLTGIYNRTEGIRILTEKIKSGVKVCVVFIDMDGLKNINDTYGHNEGDKALIELTNLIKNCIREADTLCRLGGDEFMVIFEQCQREYAEKVMARVEDSAHKANEMPDRQYNICFSYGISETDAVSDKNAMELVNRADMMMYVNKRNKKASRGMDGYGSQK